MVKETCPKCGHELGRLKIGIMYYSGKKRFCSLNCKNEYVKHNVTEIKCKCRECGKIWHYLPHEEQAQKMEETGKNMIQASACCCNPIGILTGVTRQRPRAIDSCPNCGSRNVEKTEKTYSK